MSMSWGALVASAIKAATFLLVPDKDCNVFAAKTKTATSWQPSWQPYGQQPSTVSSRSALSSSLQQLGVSSLLLLSLLLPLLQPFLEQLCVWGRLLNLFRLQEKQKGACLKNAFMRLHVNIALAALWAVYQQKIYEMYLIFIWLRDSIDMVNQKQKKLICLKPMHLPHRSANPPPCHPRLPSSPSGWCYLLLHLATASSSWSPLQPSQWLPLHRSIDLSLFHCEFWQQISPAAERLAPELWCFMFKLWREHEPSLAKTDNSL